MQIEPDHAALPKTEAWPRQVDLILSAMEAAGAYAADRRSAARQPYRTRGELKLYADPSDARALTIFTRDADSRGVGFITPHLLPLGYGGWVWMIAPNGDEICAECTIYRCRRTVHGWHEGALKFNREIWQLG